jgi:hypothetical protein
LADPFAPRNVREARNFIRGAYVKELAAIWAPRLIVRITREDV